VWPRGKYSKPKKQRSRILKHMKINIWRIVYTWTWPCRTKQVVKDSENLKYNKAARRRKHNLQNPLRFGVRHRRPGRKDIRLTGH
jgi:hypothetical protein